MLNDRSNKYKQEAKELKRNDLEEILGHHMNLSSYNFYYFQKEQKKWRIKNFFFQWLEHPSKIWEISYHIGVLVLIICTIASLFLMNNLLLKLESFTSVLILEFLILFIFSFEIITRVWSCTSVLKYKKKGRIYYLREFHNIIDMCVIILSLIEIVLILNYKDIDNQILVKTAIIAMKTTRMLRFFRYDKFLGSISLLENVIKHHKLEIATALFASFIMMVTSSFIIYFIENYNHIVNSENIPYFNSMGEAFYFIMVSFLTIGFGDFSPQTTAGRLFISVVSFLGVILAVLPSTIIGSGFAIDVESRRREKNMSSLKNASATLIQKSWKLHRLIRLYKGEFWINEYDRTLAIASKPTINLQELLKQNNKNDLNSPTILTENVDNDLDISSYSKLCLVRKYQLAYIFITKIQYYISSNGFKSFNKHLHISDMLFSIKKQKEEITDEFNETKKLVSSSIEASCIAFNQVNQKIDEINQQINQILLKLDQLDIDKK